MRWLVVVGALVSTLGGSASAQSVVRILADDFKHAGGDFAAVWTSPLRGTTDDFLTAAAVLAAGALVSPFDDNVDRWALANRDQGFLHAIRPFRRGGDLYSLNKLTPYVAGLYVVGVATNHRGIRDGVMGCLSAYAANTTIRHQVVYRLIGRDRPDTVKDRPAGEVGPPARQGDQYRFRVPSEGWKDHSFPGGHVATMATCASFFSHRFKWSAGEPVLAGLVFVMGIGRLADRGHWLSDQLVGVAFGYAVGREVARRQLRRLEAAQPGSTADLQSRRFDHNPVTLRSEQGTLIGWEIRF
jgi:membrane-associated phospholipid phosphatase